MHARAQNNEAAVAKMKDDAYQAGSQMQKKLDHRSLPPHPPPQHAWVRATCCSCLAACIHACFLQQRTYMQRLCMDQQHACIAAHLLSAATYSSASFLLYFWP